MSRGGYHETQILALLSVMIFIFCMMVSCTATNPGIKSQSSDVNVRNESILGTYKGKATFTGPMETDVAATVTISRKGAVFSCGYDYVIAVSSSKQSLMSGISGYPPNLHFDCVQSRWHGLSKGQSVRIEARVVADSIGVAGTIAVNLIPSDKSSLIERELRSVTFSGERNR